jgi:pyrroloquinoline quinone biosynthesis protein D
VQLAQGVSLIDGGTEDPCVLVGPNGKVQLNGGATAILRLCDGSRSSDEIIAAVVQSSPGQTLAADVAAFLDVARTRGWIVSL